MDNRERNCLSTGNYARSLGQAKGLGKARVAFSKPPLKEENQHRYKEHRDEGK